MSSIGSGYDLSVDTFSPDGRIFQVEYAMKAIENSSTVVGLRCVDGVVLATEKLIASQLHVQGDNSRIFKVNTLQLLLRIQIRSLQQFLEF